jgi:hypothetical protein
VHCLLSTLLSSQVSGAHLALAFQPPLGATRLTLLGSFPGVKPGFGPFPHPRRGSDVDGLWHELTSYPCLSVVVWRSDPSVPELVCLVRVTGSAR